MAVHRLSSVVGALLVHGCLVGTCHGLSYLRSWRFDYSLENQPTSLRATDYLLYNPATGGLTYTVGAGGRWSPPDVGSISGLLSAGPTEPVPLWFAPIEYRVDEEFEGRTVPGSSALRAGFDRYAPWPNNVEDEGWRTLIAFFLDLDEIPPVPTSYHFGDVLPPGLAIDFLSNDLYATSLPRKRFELRAIPEPGGVLLVAAGALLCALLRVGIGFRRTSFASPK